MNDRHCLVLTTCPDAATAQLIADAVVEQGRAACVNIIPSLRSVYMWKGALDRAEEQLLLIKTTQAVYPALEQAIRTLHPYELPGGGAGPGAAGGPGGGGGGSAAGR